MLGKFFIAAALLAPVNIASASVPEVIGAPYTEERLSTIKKSFEELVVNKTYSDAVSILKVNGYLPLDRQVLVALMDSDVTEGHIEDDMIKKGITEVVSCSYSPFIRCGLWYANKEKEIIELVTYFPESEGAAGLDESRVEQVRLSAVDKYKTWVNPNKNFNQLELRIAATNPHKSKFAFSPITPCDASCIEAEFKLEEKNRKFDSDVIDSVSHYQIMDANATHVVYIDAVLKAYNFTPLKVHEDKSSLFANDLYYVVNKVAGGSVFKCGPDIDLGSYCELLYKDERGYLYRVTLYGDSLAEMRVFAFNIVNDLPEYRIYSDSDLARAVIQHKLQYSFQNDKTLYVKLVKDEYNDSNNYFVKQVAVMHSNVHDTPHCVAFVATAFNYSISDMPDTAKSKVIDQIFDGLSGAGCLKQ